jgi:molecular chaperone HscA
MKILANLNHQESFPVVRAQNDLPCIAVNDKEYSAIDISSKILSHLKQLAESMENKTLDGAVITVPAYFNDIQRQATKNAAKMSGINVLRLLNEPTAAALAYGLESNETGSFVIYDFGGGTFDVSVLNLDKGIFKVLSTDGNTRLGGDDIDNAISIWLSNNYSFMQKYSHTEIKEYAKSIKESIANEESISIKVNENSVTLSQDQFQDIIAPILNETFEIVKNCYNCFRFIF